MSDVLPVTRIAAQSIQAVRMELGPNGQTAGVIAALMANLMNPALGLGYTTENKTDPIFNGGWQVTIKRGDDSELIAYTGDWIVVTDATYDDTNGWRLQKTSRVHIYGISAGMSGTAVDFVNAFSANTPLIWDNLATPPVAVPLDNFSAKLTIKQPVSANGPWQYRIDTGPGTAGAFSAPDEQGNITTTITGLTDQEQCAWTVDVRATQYTGITGTSAASNTITAAATAPVSVEEPMSMALEAPLRPLRGPGRRPSMQRASSEVPPSTFVR